MITRIANAPTLITLPSGRFRFVGRVPMELMFRHIDGGPPDPADVKTAQHCGPGFAKNLRERTWETEDDAQQALADYERANTPPIAKEAPVLPAAPVTKTISIYTDGGARGTPGPSSCAAVAFDHDGTKIAEDGRHLGIGTCNEAEWNGLIMGLELALRLGATHVELRSDSQLAIRQFTGANQIHAEHLKPFFARAHAIAAMFIHVNAEHVRRNFNKEADAITRRILDAPADGSHTMTNAILVRYDVTIRLHRFFSSQAELTSFRLAQGIESTVATDDAFRASATPMVLATAPTGTLAFRVTVEPSSTGLERHAALGTSETALRSLLSAHFERRLPFALESASDGFTANKVKAASR